MSKIKNTATSKNKDKHVSNDPEHTQKTQWGSEVRGCHIHFMTRLEHVVAPPSRGRSYLHTDP